MSKLVARLMRRRGMPEFLVGFPVLYALHRHGLAVPGSFWLFMAAVFAGALVLDRVAVWRAPRAQSLWAGRAEMILQVVHVTLVLCLTGWAPLLGIAFLLLAAKRLNELAGSWRCTLILGLSAMTAIQAGIAAGLVQTYLPATTAHVAGALSAMCVGLGIRIMGLNAVARAAAETAQAAGDEAVRHSEERFRTVIEASWDVITITDASGAITFVSASVEHVMGWTESEYRTLPPDRRVHPDDLPLVLEQAAAIAAGAAEYRTEVRLGHGDGAWHWHEVLARNLIDHPAVRGIVYNHRDVTVRKQREELLAHQATHDALTGLANRAVLRDRLTAWCAGHRPVPGAVLFLDLDGFKQVNDELGHAAGDAVLTRTARALLDSVTADDTVARLGGDEFAVLLTGVRTEREAAATADQVIARLGTHGAIRTSIGIAMCEPGRLDARETLHRADLAMYHAKRVGDHGWVVYDEHALASLIP